MKLLNLFKLFFLLSMIGMFTFLYVKVNYYPYSEISSRLESSRPNAFFLELDESVLKKLSQKEYYGNIDNIILEEGEKENLFDGIQKENYNF